MIVYAQSEQEDSPLGVLLRRFGSELLAANFESSVDVSVDAVRNLLILAGQIEQAVSDHYASGAAIPSLARFAAALTDTAADAFVSFWPESQPQCHSPERRRMRTAIDAAFQKLKEWARNSGELMLKLQVKTPEGFAFYSLFPEQYRASALEWASARRQQQSNDRRVLVAGIRSIGTTLSSVVAATLRQAGWVPQRITVRPTGPPFKRIIEAPLPHRRQFGHALAVDEGPGLSGSSLAAAAEWFARAGIEDFAFLPGHAGEPGSEASAEVRQWWQKTPRYFVSLEQVRWAGRNLTEVLAEQSQNWCGTIEECVDVSAGGWRSEAFSGTEMWPAVCKTFERSKFLMKGKRKKLLWKFKGLGVRKFGAQEIQDYPNAARPGEDPAAAGGVLAPPTLGYCRGFIAFPWIEGERLCASEAKDDGMIRRIAWQIVNAAARCSRELSDGEAESARRRLQEMLYWNTREALGEQCADQALKLWESVGVLPDRLRLRAGSKGTAAPAGLGLRLAYGDGRLAPHEWVRVADGAVVYKTDSGGHDADHTVVGRQPILWDVAGAVIEWSMDKRRVEKLNRALVDQGIGIDDRVLRFYRAAYAAFRMGFVSLGLGQTAEHGDGERERLRDAFERYKHCLAKEIGADCREGFYSAHEDHWAQLVS